MILDYNKCQKLMDSFNNTIITEVSPIGYTSNEKLPIRHFTLGNGSKQVVVAGSQHANEIITVTFVLNLMSYLVKNNIVFEDLTIHFIPILNPEGYVVISSAIKEKLGKNATDNEITKFCFDYYKAYREDTRNKESSIKQHQKLFEDINEKAIKEYSILKDSVGEILIPHPKGSIIDWASNGSGIDLNSNTKENIKEPKTYNKSLAYNNLRVDIPSPIGYPGNNQSKNFTQEVEVISLENLLKSLKNNCVAFLNYHSVGGLIYQRPENNDRFITNYNYLLSKFYQEHTIKNSGNYDIKKGQSGKVTSVNDELRLKYPGDILIELSPMGGNPIGPFGDPNNIKSTIESNILSFIYTMSNLNKVITLTNQSLENNATNIEETYKSIDEVYEQSKKSR
ncbi:MAG: M14 family zinc carboxypeptidase [Firmicutes bacterium]|nr:M14 family zinc carboxypeptidase [Bacillota bacterium]MDY5335239.1 M14 family zinc carboxypeptidase [Bacilli bacterium]